MYHLQGMRSGSFPVEVIPNRGVAEFQVCAIRDAQLKINAEVLAACEKDG
jgi:hypothetical protein